MKRTFANTERDVLCGHFPRLVQRKTFSSALVLLPQVTHNHQWFLNGEETVKRSKMYLCSVGESSR